MSSEYIAARQAATGGRYALVVWQTCEMCGKRFATDRVWAHARFMQDVPVRQCKFCHPGGHFGAPEPTILDG